MKGSSSSIRFSEAQKLLDYGFNNFEYIEFSKKGDILKSINVDKGIVSKLDAIFEEDSGCLVKKGDAKNITTTISIHDTISAPIYKGEKLGEITYLIDGNIIAFTNIIAKEDVKKLTFVNMCSRTIEGWFKLLR